MDTVKRILYGIVGLANLGFACAIVGGLALMQWFLPALLETHDVPPPTLSLLSLPGALLIIFILNGIGLLMAAILRHKWLAKPQWALMAFSAGCVLTLLTLLPNFFAKPRIFGSYDIMAILCFVSLAHDISISLCRAKRLKASKNSGVL